MHLFETGNTAPLDPSWFEFEKIHVKSEGYLNMLTDPVTENEINLKVEKIVTSAAPEVNSPIYFCISGNV